MAEMFIPDRIVFTKKGVQQQFLVTAKEKSKLDWKGFSVRVRVEPRSLTDWKSEKLRMPFSVAKRISTIVNVRIPKPYVIRSHADHLKKISRQGGRAIIAKYGRVSQNETYRKKRWLEWWKKTGQFQEPAKGYQIKLKVKTPGHSKKLAEFIGIMLGDGGMSRYQVTVSLSSTEVAYHLYVQNLMHELFGTRPTIYPMSDSMAVKIVISRRHLVEVNKSFGLIEGNKIFHQIDIPKWVKDSVPFLKECIRGLVDTDGCFYTNTYKVNNKNYTFFKIAFTSASPPLVASVANFLKKQGIKVSITRNGRDVRIVGKEDVRRYINIIGSSNQKHITKIEEFYGTPINCI